MLRKGGTKPTIFRRRLDYRQRKIALRHLYLRDGNKCQVCGIETTEANGWPSPEYPTLDHYPVCFGDGGSNELSNLRVCCWRCNVRLGVKRVFGIEGMCHADNEKLIAWWRSKTIHLVSKKSGKVYEAWEIKSPKELANTMREQEPDKSRSARPEPTLF